MALPRFQNIPSWSICLRGLGASTKAKGQEAGEYGVLSCSFFPDPLKILQLLAMVAVSSENAGNALETCLSHTHGAFSLYGKEMLTKHAVDGTNGIPIIWKSLKIRKDIIGRGFSFDKSAGELRDMFYFDSEDWLRNKRRQ